MSAEPLTDADLAWARRCAFEPSSSATFDHPLAQRLIATIDRERERAERAEAQLEDERREGKYYVKARVYGAIASRFRVALESIATRACCTAGELAREALAWRHSERNGVPVAAVMAVGEMLDASVRADAALARAEQAESSCAAMRAAALEAVDGWSEANTYVPEYFLQKWRLAEREQAARAVLASDAGAALLKELEALEEVLKAAIEFTKPQAVRPEWEVYRATLVHKIAKLDALRGKP